MEWCWLRFRCPSTNLEVHTSPCTRSIVSTHSPSSLLKWSIIDCVPVPLMDKHTQTCASHYFDFVPFGFSVFGSLGPAAPFWLLGRICRRYRIHARIDDWEAYALVHCHLSFAVMRGMADQFVGCRLDSFWWWFILSWLLLLLIAFTLGTIHWPLLSCLTCYCYCYCYYYVIWGCEWNSSMRSEVRVEYAFFEDFSKHNAFNISPNAPTISWFWPCSNGVANR